MKLIGAGAAGKKGNREKKKQAGEGSEDAQEKLSALKKRALARREAGVGKKARLLSNR
jgi:hypothetical protein